MKVQLWLALRYGSVIIEDEVLEVAM